MYQLKSIKTASDYHLYARVLMYGETPEDYKLAYEFAKKALELGDDSTQWLFEETLDRIRSGAGMSRVKENHKPKKQAK